MHCPGERHFKALKRFLRYIKGTLDKGIVFDFSAERIPRPFVYGFFDAAHTDDVDTRRSTLAYVFFWAGVPIAYKTKLHTFITTSTNHSELVAAASACRVAKTLWKLFSALGFDDQVTPIDLLSDSMGCLFISHGEGTSASLRHIELADFFARECISRGIVTMAHVATGRMIADPLTKPLPAPSFRELTKFLVGTVIGRDLSESDFSSFPPLSSQVSVCPPKRVVHVRERLRRTRRTPVSSVRTPLFPEGDEGCDSELASSYVAPEASDVAPPGAPVASDEVAQILAISAANPEFAGPQPWTLPVRDHLRPGSTDQTCEADCLCRFSAEVHAQLE